MRPRALRTAATVTLFAAPLLLSCVPQPGTSWWRHVRWLADDARRGRETGSPGYLSAAQYVAHEFERAGALPAGTDGYFQPISFVGHRLVEPECRVILARSGGRSDTLALGDDGVLSTSIAAAESLDAPVVFVGYGLQLPDAGLHDLDGIDLRGAIAVYLRGAPKDVPSTVAAHAQNTGQRWARMRERGALGTIGIPNPKAMSLPWERIKANRLDEGLTMADSALDERGGMRFSMYVNRARAERFFTGSGHTYAEIAADAEASRPLPRFVLPYRIRARIRMTERRVQSPNVVAILPGSDPTLRGESVVLSAHLDHLGVGAPIHGDSIYNGAMDNASGVASLIEIAHAIHSGTPPRRSIVLLALTGEEEGLLGSCGFAAHPPAAVGNMVADINVDMFLPITKLRSVIAYGEKESDLGDWFHAAADSAKLKVQPDPEPLQNYFVRSDQYNFILAGVPSIFVDFGPGDDPAIQRRFAKWREDRYHAPSDDAQQPIDLAAADAFNRILLGFTREVANRPDAPHWKADSFFRRFERGVNAAPSLSGATAAVPNGSR